MLNYLKTGNFSIIFNDMSHYLFCKLLSTRGRVIFYFILKYTFWFCPKKSLKIIIVKQVKYYNKLNYFCRVLRQLKNVLQFS